MELHIDTLSSHLRVRPQTQADSLDQTGSKGVDGGMGKRFGLEDQIPPSVRFVLVKGQQKDLLVIHSGDRKEKKKRIHGYPNISTPCFSQATRRCQARPLAWASLHSLRSSWETHLRKTRLIEVSFEVPFFSSILTSHTESGSRDPSHGAARDSQAWLRRGKGRV